MIVGIISIAIFWETWDNQGSIYKGKSTKQIDEQLCVFTVRSHHSFYIL